MVSKGRLAGFIDAIIAVVMTIMLLEFELPKTGGIIEFLRDNLVYLIAYLLSFIYVTTSWFNQQYMIQQAETLAVGFTTVACSGFCHYPCFLFYLLGLDGQSTSFMISDFILQKLLLYFLS